MATPVIEDGNSANCNGWQTGGTLKAVYSVVNVKEEANA
jgi:hypothetical protein